MEKRTAILAGATGLVGSFVLNELIQNGNYEKIIVLSRRAGHYTNKRVELIITVGYPASDDIRPKKRKPWEEICSYNSYKSKEG